MQFDFLLKVKLKHIFDLFFLQLKFAKDVVAVHEL